MDLLFMESVVTDPGFLREVMNKTELHNCEFEVLDASLSVTDTALGESDITIIAKAKDKQIAILIEDKIDAIAMPDQYQRYKKRGEKGVKAREYEEFYIFIFCPLKYYENNNEAKKYDYFFSYEDALIYFSQKTDPMSRIRAQRLDQAINKVKNSTETVINERANAFFYQYRLYQKNKYPELDMRTSETSNGWWPHYGTRLGKVYIYHKTQEGFVDLTFPNAASRIEVLEEVAPWMRAHGIANVFALKTGNAATLRIEVPKLKVEEDFECTNQIDLDACLDAVVVLSRFANMVEAIGSLSSLKKKAKL